jgi:hypothetical protein
VDRRRSSDDGVGERCATADSVAYANAEWSRQAPRDKNAHGITPEAYARALSSDGLRKGWLRER